MLYRCLSIIFSGLLLSACQDVFSSGRYPKDMPPLSEFKVLGTNVSDCGFREKLTETIKVVDPSEGKMEVWNMWQKEGALYPYKIVRRYMNHGLPVFEVFWVYKSSTDSYEYFDNIVDFGRQYPRSCQAAEDHAARNHGTY